MSASPRTGRADSPARLDPHVRSRPPAPHLRQERPTTSTSAPQKITTFLMFKGEVEEAMQFYTSLFEDADVLASTGCSRGACKRRPEP